MKYFKVKSNYTNKENNNVSEVRLFEAISYQDAESRATNYLEKNIHGECEFEISKVSYDEIIRYKGEEDKVEELYWYEVRICFISVNDKGEERYSNKKYLVEVEDLPNVIDAVEDFLNDSMEDWYFTQISETPIEEFVSFD